MTTRPNGKQKRTLVHSLNNAVEGFIYVVKHERNMRLHFLLGFLVLLAAIFMGVSRLEWIILCAIISFVLVTEMINTVIEEILDLVERSHHPDIRIIKDMSAGAVLVSVFTALVVGFFIFSKYWAWPIEKIAIQARHADWHITFVALLVVIFLVIAGKAFFHRGTPFRGGAVSGHAAIAFAVAATLLFTQNNVYVVSVVFLLALLVAQSRLRAKIHSFWEVVAGALLGMLVTALFFQIFR